jgi:hypothetical protein
MTGEFYIDFWNINLPYSDKIHLKNVIPGKGLKAKNLLHRGFSKIKRF